MLRELQFLTLKSVEADYFAIDKNICCSLCSFIGLHRFPVLLWESRNDSPTFHVTNWNTWNRWRRHYVKDSAVKICLH